MVIQSKKVYLANASTDIIYRRQSMYAEAKQLFERAIPVLLATGKRREEAVSYGELGYVFQSLGE